MGTAVQNEDLESDPVTTLHQPAPIHHFLHSDANGNIVLATTVSGTVSGVYAYTPYGQTIARTGDFASRYGFSSKEQDLESGLVYYGYRFYAPEQGRWMSRDPIGEADGANLYRFVGNAAVIEFDSHGLRSRRTGRANDVERVERSLPGRPSGPVKSEPGRFAEFPARIGVDIAGPVPSGGGDSGPLLLPRANSKQWQQGIQHPKVPEGSSCRVDNECSVTCENICGTWSRSWRSGHIRGTVQTQPDGERRCVTKFRSADSALMRCKAEANSKCAEGPP